MSEYLRANVAEVFTGEEEVSSMDNENLTITESHGLDFDFGHLGSNVLQVMSGLNIRYDYLNPELELTLGQIQEEIVFPILQERIRNKENPLVLKEQIDAVAAVLDPRLMPASSFVELMHSVYRRKIVNQQQMSLLLSGCIDNAFDEDQLQRAGDLLAESESVEPYFFAISQRMKDFIDFALNNISERYQLYEEDELLLSSPAQASFYTLRMLDHREAVLVSRGLMVGTELSVEDHVEILANRYYNGSLSRARKAIENERDINVNVVGFEAMKEGVHQWWLRKFYYLQSRKLYGALDVDELLFFDNTVDKFFQSKNCLMHDIFLRAKMEEIPKKNWSQCDTAEMREKVRNVINNL